MSQPLTKKDFAPGSLRRPRSARTLLLRMAADEARAQRFRETYEQRKAENPREYTWRRLADHVDVSERAAQDWAKTGGIEYDNAKKAAEFWGVDFDWLWRGPKEGEQTPDPFSDTASRGQVDDGFDEFRQYVRDIRRDISDVAQREDNASQEREGIRALLAQQSQILSDIASLLARQEAILLEMRRVADGLPDDENLRMLNEAAQELTEVVARRREARSEPSSGQAGERRRAAGD